MMIWLDETIFLIDEYKCTMSYAISGTSRSNNAIHAVYQEGNYSDVT